MTARDFHNTVSYANGFMSLATMPASAATVAVTDRATTPAGALEFVIVKDGSTATTALVVVDIQSHNTATSGHALATTAERLGAALSMTATTAGVGKLGYIGSDRYVSLRVTPAVATGQYAVVVVKGGPIKQPQS